MLICIIRCNFKRSRFTFWQERRVCFQISKDHLRYWRHEWRTESHLRWTSVYSGPGCDECISYLVLGHRSLQTTALAFLFSNKASACPDLWQQLSLLSELQRIVDIFFFSPLLGYGQLIRAVCLESFSPSLKCEDVWTSFKC